MYKIKIKIRYCKDIRYLTVIIVILEIIVMVMANRNMIEMMLNMQYNKLINMDITIIIRHSNIKIMNNNKYKKCKSVQILKKDIKNSYNL